MDLAASRRLVRNPRLRALMAAWTGFCVGSFGHAVLLVVFAFSVGGASAVGASMLVRVLPGGLISPFAASLATSPRAQLHLAAAIGTRCILATTTSLSILGGAPLTVVLVFVAVDSIVWGAARPLHGALVVRAADTAGEVAAANAISGSLVSASALAGPALAGVVLNFVSVGWAFLFPAAAFAAGALAALMIRVPQDHTRMLSTVERVKSRQPERRRSRRSARDQVSALGTGFRAVATSGPAFAATLIYVVNVMLIGVWYTASASVADDVLGLGEGGITTIMTFNGIGGVLGALATLSIVGRRGLPTVLAIAMVGCAVAFAAIGALRLPLAGFALSAGLGATAAAANAIAPTLVQRSVVRDKMVPAAASLQSLYLVANAAGTAIAATLIHAVGITSAMAGIGGATLVMTAIALPMLRCADELSEDDSAKLAVIRATSMLAPLPALALEQLARASTRVMVPAGSDVIRQGDRGDRFYMIASGIADVTVDYRRVATLGPGGSFGEIALLNDVRRSATVTAREDLALIVVDRAEFLGALTSDTETVGHIDGVARARIETPPVEDRLVQLSHHAAALGDRSIVDLLRTQRPLSMIKADALRDLAAGARILAATDRAMITREGDHGDTYYVILNGGAQVFEGTRLVGTLGPGDGFGEQSILRDVPRTATVRAVGETELLAVDREAFQRAFQAR